MGHVKPYEKEKLVTGILYSDPSLLDSVKEQMISLYGPIDYESPDYSFSEFSDYYDKEMGGSVRRILISFHRLIDPSELATIKEETDRIESFFAVDGNRRINIDPGTMGPGKFILATTKQAPHRIALRNGYWAEITLFYARGNFQVLPWTYPDFRSESVRKHLCEIRKSLLKRS